MLSRVFLKGMIFVKRIVKPAFCVIGKEGCTDQGSGFIQRLWEDANGHFAEIAALAKRDESGNLTGIWGAMTDTQRRFQPWEENFSRGLYLAGVECVDDAVPPDGWVKWQIPGFEYLQVENTSNTIFGDTIAYLQANNMMLAGAVQEWTIPAEEKHYLLFPIRRLE